MVRFSVIIPTYNRAVYLGELLECLVNQTYKNFEVLVCDDGSTDNTKQIVEQYNNQLDIHYFYNDNWGGPARPRNIGIKNSSADWLCFVDSDDLWEPAKLFEMQAVINDKVDVIYHLFKIMDSDQVIGAYRKSMFLDHQKSLLFNGNRVVNSSLCIRKTVIAALGGFTEERRFIGVEDYDLLIRAAESKATFFFVPKVLGQYRVNETNISKDFLLQIKKIEALLNFHAGLVRATKVKVAAVVDYMMGSHLMNTQERSVAKKYLLKSLIYGSNMMKIKSSAKLVKCFYGK